MRTKLLLLLVWCLSVGIVSAQQEPKIKIGPELLSYPEIAKRMSVGGKQVECARNLQNSMAVIHLKSRPWSEVKQLLTEGLGVRLRLKEKPKESDTSKEKTPESRTPNSEPGAEVWVMERAPETVRLESEQQKRFIDYWLERTDRADGFMFFMRGFSDLPYKDVKEFFEQYKQQRETMMKYMIEHADEFNNASSFVDIMKNYGPDLSTVPPPILQRLKKVASDLRKMLQEMAEEEEGSSSMPDIEEFLQVKDESFMQMMLLFASEVPSDASGWLLNRWWDQGLMPQMAREAIRNGMSVRTMPLNQALLRDIPLEELFNDSFIKGGGLLNASPSESKRERPPYDLLLLSLELGSMDDSLYLQARLNACLPDIYRSIPSYFTVNIPLNGRTYTHVMQTDKQAWKEKNKQLQEFLKKEAMQKKFLCERQYANSVSGVLLAWARETGSEVIAEYSLLHDTIMPFWASPFTQTMTIDEGDYEVMAEAEAIESDQPVTAPDERPAIPVPPPVTAPEPPQPPAKMDVTLARAFGEKTRYDLQETHGVLVALNRWSFLNHLWDLPFETILRFTEGQSVLPDRRERVLDYDTLSAFYRAITSMQGILVDSLYLFSYAGSSELTSLRPAVHILSMLSPTERRQLLTEGGVISLSRLSGAALSQLVASLRVNVEKFPNAWHSGFTVQLPAWQLKLTLDEDTHQLHVSLEPPKKEITTRPTAEENEETEASSDDQSDFFLGRIKAIVPPQKRPN